MVKIYTLAFFKNNEQLIRVSVDPKRRDMLVHVLKIDAYQKNHWKAVPKIPKEEVIDLITEKKDELEEEAERLICQRREKVL